MYIYTGTSQAACFAVNFSVSRELWPSLGFTTANPNTWYNWYSPSYDLGWEHGFTSKNNVVAPCFNRRLTHAHRNQKVEKALPYVFISVHSFFIFLTSLLIYSLTHSINQSITHSFTQHRYQVTRPQNQKFSVRFCHVENAAFHLNNWDISADGRTFSYQSEHAGNAYSYMARTDFFLPHGKRTIKPCTNSLVIRLTSTRPSIKQVHIGMVSKTNPKQYVLSHSQSFKNGDIVSFSYDLRHFHVRLNKKKIKTSLSSIDRSLYYAFAITIRKLILFYPSFPIFNFTRVLDHQQKQYRNASCW